MGGDWRCNLPRGGRFRVGVGLFNDASFLGFTVYIGSSLPISICQL